MSRDAHRPTLRLGTRASALALAQSGQVAAALESRHPGLRVELVPIITRGDREPGALAEIGGKGLFTEALERGLLDGDLDLAVHSLKDLPVRVPEGLVIAAHPRRADPRDVLIANLDASKADPVTRLAPGATVLTGSLRRRGQLLAARPDLEIVAIRGNVDTRIRRWRDEKHGGVVLAAAGIARLGIEALPVHLPTHALAPEVMLPAPGQGVLGLQVRAGASAEPFVRALDDPSTAACADAERRIVAALGADCTLPLAAYAETRDDGTIHLRALLTHPDGTSTARGEGEGESAQSAAEACLRTLDDDGAEALLAAIR